MREYRELEAGARVPSWETWDRICKLFGWPQTFAEGGAVPDWARILASVALVLLTALIIRSTRR